MFSFFECKNIENIKDDSFELIKFPKIKKNTYKDLNRLKYNLITTTNSTQCLSNRKTNTEEEYIPELKIIEYPEQKKNINSSFTNCNYKLLFYPSKKILDDDQELNNEDFFSNSNSDEENDYSNNNIKNIIKEKDNKSKYCIYCEEIYKNAYKNKEKIIEKNCIYCNKLININTFNELVKEGCFDSDDDSVIENCCSYYGDN